ncbi:MAG: ABC transporter permease [Chloroflexi bacterium]|nr:ABC transporter permease [Chloroflexota bacterium]
MSHWRAVYIIWYRDLLRFWRDKARIIGALAHPLMFLLIFGVGLSRGLSLGALQPLGGVDYVKFLFPGVVAMVILFTSMFSAMSILWDMEFGFLKEVLVAPISRTAVALGKALGGSTIGMLQGVLVLALAPLIGIMPSWQTVVQMLPVMFLTAFSLTSMGILLATKLKSFEGFPMIMNFLVMPMFFLSGALFPLENVPTWMGSFIRINPLTYGVDPLRQIILSGANPHSVSSPAGLSVLGHIMTVGDEVIVLVLFSALMMVLAARSFSRQE